MSNNLDGAPTEEAKKAAKKVSQSNTDKGEKVKG
jgi:hypothetical protein